MWNRTDLLIDRTLIWRHERNIVDFEHQTDTFGAHNLTLNFKIARFTQQNALNDTKSTNFGRSMWIKCIDSSLSGLKWFRSNKTLRLSVHLSLEWYNSYQLSVFFSSVTFIALQSWLCYSKRSANDLLALFFCWLLCPLYSILKLSSQLLIIIIVLSQVLLLSQLIVNCSKFEF